MPVLTERWSPWDISYISNYEELPFGDEAEVPKEHNCDPFLYSFYSLIVCYRYLRNFDFDYMSIEILTLLHKPYLRFYLLSWLLWTRTKWSAAWIPGQFWPSFLSLLVCARNARSISVDYLLSVGMALFILPRWCVTIKKRTFSNVLLEGVFPSKTSIFLL